jgi:uncharacterized protein YktA (UPF0223 family)
MVQILEDNSPQSQRFSGLSRLMQGMGLGAERLKGALDERQTRNVLADRFGQEFKNVRNPNVQQMMLQDALRQEEIANKARQEEMSLPDYEMVKNKFGEDFADLYKAAPVGGKTELLKAGLAAMLRGENIQDMFAGAEGPQISDQPKPNISDILPEGEGGFQPGKGKLNLPDYTKRPPGYTPKEWNTVRSGWRDKNVDTLTSARDRLKANKRDVLGTKKLIKLNDSGRLPEGLSRLIINPSTGSPYGLAQLGQIQNPEAEEWVKEIARFGNRAKDAYGSRVTNFDLQQYMKQFPSLLNSKEGRKRILRMMEINYELDSQYDQAVQRILDSTPAGNIPPEEVDRLAREMIKDKEESLFDEYLGLENQNETSFMEEGISKKRPSLEDIFA